MKASFFMHFPHISHIKRPWYFYRGLRTTLVYIIIIEQIFRLYTLLFFFITDKIINANANPYRDKNIFHTINNIYIIMKVNN